MKNLFRVFSVALVIMMAFAVTGCGKNDDINDDDNEDTGTTLTTNQVAELFSNLIDLDNCNFTVLVNAEYELSQQVGDQIQSQQESIENVILKIDDSNAYINVPEEFESIMYNEWTYTREYQEGWEDYNISYNSESSNPLTMVSNYSDSFESLMRENFANITNFDSSWLTSEKLSSGAYKLTIDANMKSDFIALKSALANGGDKTLGQLLNDILAIHYGSEFTVEAIITDLLANINSTSTLQDVIVFIENEFGFSMANSLTAISAIIDEMGGDVPDLLANFYTIAEIEDDAAFAQMINNFVTSYLNEETLTINQLLSTIDENSSSELIFIKNLYISLSQITINNFEVVTELTTNETKDGIATISLSVNAGVTTDNTTYTVVANGSLEFSNVGSTTIIIPEITNENTQGCHIVYYVEPNVLVASTQYVVQNVAMGSIDITFEEVDGGTLVYSPQNHTLTLSAIAVDKLLQSNFICFNDAQQSYQINFYILGIN